MIRHFQFLAIIICSSLPLHSQYVEIPDPIFYNVLIEEGVDIDGDRLISHAEADEIDTLDISYKNIHDLKGIEEFSNLVELDCSRNNLKEIDISNNARLVKLNCMDNLLTGFDVTNNPALTELKCEFNRLTALDVSENPALLLLGCDANPLGHLDVSNNIGLRKLSCLDSRIETLELSNNVHLEFLRCNFNPLTGLDVSQNTLLKFFECLCTGLDSLDVSENKALTYLGCNFNPLTTLDLSNNTSLKQLYCGYNPLTVLDISNNRSLEELNISGMPCLTEVCVWTLPFPVAGLEVYDHGSPNFLYKDCGGPLLNVNSILNNPEYIESVRIFPNPAKDILNIQTGTTEFRSIQIISLDGMVVYSSEISGIIHQIDLSVFQPGTYFIKIRSQRLLVARRIIKL